MSEPAAYLLVHFTPNPADGEQVYFAVSDGPRPTRIRSLSGGRPVLRSRVGETGVRDPFVVRDADSGRFWIIATDLRVQESGDWHRTTRWGSRSIVVWESEDLVDWSEPRLVEVAPPQAGNVWAPKAFHRGDEWLVFWASAIYDDDDDRAAASYQRILMARTTDFRTFTTPEPYLDLGHDVIDVTFAQFQGAVLRFSANAQSSQPDKTAGFHIFVERGTDLLDTAFEPVAVDVGKPELDRAEGPAVACSFDGNAVYLFIDEFMGRGYQLFTSCDPLSGTFTHASAADLPRHARHGSLLPITAAERDRLVRAYGLAVSDQR
jgi:hypothetical protein